MQAYNTLRVDVMQGYQASFLILSFLLENLLQGYKPSLAVLQVGS